MMDTIQIRVNGPVSYVTNLVPLVLDLQRKTVLIVKTFSIEIVIYALKHAILNNLSIKIGVQIVMNHA